METYKGFDNDLKCRGFQYEVGKTYETKDQVGVCKNGFHACANPFDVMNYYFLDQNAHQCRFCTVEQSGQIDTDKDYSKIASSIIKIKAEIKFAEFIKVCVEWIKEKTIKKMTDNNDEDFAQIGSSGDSAQIGSSGDFAQIGSSGDSAQIGSSGDYAKIGSSGDYAQIGSSGDSAQIGSSGDYAKIGSSGDSAKIGSSGYSAKIGSSGYFAQIGSSGDSAQIGSSGDFAKIGSSGDSAKIGSSGDSAQIGSSGDSAQIDSTGADSVICCAGHNSRVKAKIGSWITLAEWGKDENKNRHVPKCVKTIYIDGDQYKPDTWYMLKNGEITEVL